MKLDDILTILLAIVTIVAVVSPYVAGLSWVKKRPGLENFITGAGNFAARVKHEIPAGSTFAQAEAIIASKMGPFLAEYAESEKAAKLTAAQSKSIAVSATLAQLPVGHVVAPEAPPAADDIVQQVIAKLAAQSSAPAPATPGTATVGAVAIGGGSPGGVTVAPVAVPAA